MDGFRFDGIDDLAAVKIVFEQLLAGTRRPAMGRELYRRMDDVGLVDRELVNVTTVLHDFEHLGFARWDETVDLAVTAGDLQAERARAAVDALRAAAERDRLTCIVTVFVGIGRVPG
jgi:hypothetical protein